MNTDKVQPPEFSRRRRTKSDREAYERDVADAQAAYDANPSSMNHESLYAAKKALKRLPA